MARTLASEQMTKPRCVRCGCSRLDSKAVGCILCGGSPGFRDEQCYITVDTKSRLLAHAAELEKLGLKVEHRIPLQKSGSEFLHHLSLEHVAFALAVADSLNSGVLRKLVLLLRDIAIPESEIIRLRLDEPENISEILHPPKHRKSQRRTSTGKLTKKRSR